MKNMVASACAAALLLFAGVALAQTQSQQAQAQQLPASASANSASQFAAQLRSVKIVSLDFARTTTFYTALGMKAGVNRGQTADLTWDGASGNSGLVIVDKAYGERAKMQRGGTYFMFLTPDVRAAVARLKAAGFADVPEPKAMGTLVSYSMLKDPDGNSIELLGPLIK